MTRSVTGIALSWKKSMTESTKDRPTVPQAISETSVLGRRPKQKAVDHEADQRQQRDEKQILGHQTFPTISSC